ncbi:MAG: transposase [Actinobacteria bacterium]|nr:transposase [Actinomycetota bacterium]
MLCRYRHNTNNVAERSIRGPVVGRKNYYGSGSKWAATLAARAWTITATANQAGLNPLEYLVAYLEACATSGGKAPSGEALERFFPWAVSEPDLENWSNLASGPAP